MEKHGDGFEAAENDFVYETSCSIATKKYEMGKNVDRHEVPVTVQELSSGNKVKENGEHQEKESRNTFEKVQENICKTSSVVPTTVENLVKSETFQTSTESASNKQTLARTEETFSSSFSTSSTTSTLERTKSVSKPFNIVTSLPPLPRSHSQKMMFGRESRSNSFSKASETVNSKSETSKEFKDGDIMEPVEVKIKTLPRKVPGFVGAGTLNKAEENPQLDNNRGGENDLCSDAGEIQNVETNDNAVVVKAEPAIVIENTDSNHEAGKRDIFKQFDTYELVHQAKTNWDHLTSWVNIFKIKIQYIQYIQ